MARILIADDQPIVRAAIVKVIAGSGEDWEVCGVVDNGESAIEETVRLKPDLVILDLRMPRRNGISAGREIRKIFPEVPVLIYTWADAAVTEGVVRDAGLQGVVEKSNGGAILMAIRDVLAGKTVFSSGSTAADVRAPVLEDSTPATAQPSQDVATREAVPEQAIDARSEETATQPPVEPET